MTRPQIKLYYHYLVRRKFKELEAQATLMWGYSPKNSQKNIQKKKAAENWTKDPLHGFPNDIEYFTRRQVEAKLSVSNWLGKRGKPESKWNKERGDACLGRYGVVARRCSMNDKLWIIYQRAKTRNIILTLAEIKRMILIDIKRSKLYPQGWADDSVSPPKNYIDELNEKGLLDAILKEIDEAVRS